MNSINRELYYKIDRRDACPTLFGLATYYTLLITIIIWRCVWIIYTLLLQKKMEIGGLVGIPTIPL